YYDLGLPLPTQTPTATETVFTTKTTATYARDAGGVVTMTTSTAHGLKSGAFVTISGFTNRSGTYTQGGTTTTTASITGITQALPAVVTAPSHGFTTGDSVTISGVAGMTAVNGGPYTITVLTGNTFQLDGIDSTGFGAYTSGGTASRTVASAGTTITVTLANHGLVVGSQVLLRFTSGTAASNIFTVATTPTANTFTVTSTTSVTTSGNVDWDITNLNATSIEITVVNPTTFTYTSPGFQSTTISSSDGRVDLAGATQARTYLYTWYTPWEEESIGSEPSNELFIKEGQVVTISNLPTTRPAGKNQIAGIRLYRTLSTVADTEYLRLVTLWFPVTVSTVVGTTVTTAQPHNLSVGNYFKISTGVSGGRVTDVIDDFTFTYTGGVGSGGSGGTLYHDVSENPGTTTPRYWGDGSFNFTDDFSVTSLLNALVTDDYDPPPEDLKGLTLFNNNILVGFVGNELYFSEPGQFHAWPRVYKQDVPHNIVGLSVFSSYLLVATDNYPYLVQGNDPAVFSIARIDARYPCLNKRSIAAVGFG
ncbi:MAG TPA: ubiquitin-activating E1 FCCH domain-containing protein, partial [Acidimicrobiia bacterium]